MGSAGLAAWVAHGAFWALLGLGWLFDELGVAGIAVFVALWIIGYFGLPYLPNGAALFAPFVAVLDIALVFAIFKGDVGGGANASGL
jgi:hypothetical protein